MHYKKRKRKLKIARWPTKDWLVSHLMLSLALENILKKVKINRKYDIPYLSGYSRDGKTIYIDRHMPKIFNYKGRKIRTDRYLVLHETIEKILIDRLKLHYQFAHQIALRAEQASVRSDKISWHAYDKFMQKYIKEIGNEKLKNVPKNLDLK